VISAAEVSGDGRRVIDHGGDLVRGEEYQRRQRYGGFSILQRPQKPSRLFSDGSNTITSKLPTIGKGMDSFGQDCGAAGVKVRDILQPPEAGSG
jgi:hypothetical protein